MSSVFSDTDDLLKMMEVEDAYAADLLSAGEDIQAVLPQVRFTKTPYGAVPVQAEGDFGRDGTEFYFRYRNGIARLQLYRQGGRKLVAQSELPYGHPRGGMLSRGELLNVFTRLVELLPSDERRSDQVWVDEPKNTFFPEDDSVPF